MPGVRLLLTVLAVLSTSSGSTSSPRQGLPPLAAVVPITDNGDLVRTVEPFGGWTLVCERRLSERRCNLSQQIVDPRGRLAFSWTLAPHGNGAPLLLLRSLDEGNGSKSVEIEIGRLAPVRATLGTCNNQVCLGAVQISSAFDQALVAENQAAITLMIKGRLTTLKAPLTGLRRASAALRL